MHSTIFSTQTKQMRVGLPCLMAVLFTASLIRGQATSQSMARVPTGVILVKGAWASASDAAMPLPEGGSVTNGVFTDRYFGIGYALHAGWTEGYKGPPPSDSGRYVLTQLIPGASLNGRVQGSILFTAQDLFFTPMPMSNAKQLIAYRKETLQTGYQVETAPAQTTIAGRTFASFGYWSPVAGLHWYVLAAEIRCHIVEIVLTGRDSALLKSLIEGMNKMDLPAGAGADAGLGGGDAPVCIKDFARGENVVAKVDPILTEHRFNPVPVRVIIDTSGNVKHIHFLSAFDDQAKAISDALGKWRFKPYRQDQRPVEVETGILFGRAPRASEPPGGGNR
jgi:hypothetical protein